MGSVSKKRAAKRHPDWQPTSDNAVLRLLADQRGRAISEISAHFHVTPTAIRQRLDRLTWRQLVGRRLIDATGKRGRPQHVYFITSKGEAALAAASDDE